MAKGSVLSRRGPLGMRIGERLAHYELLEELGHGGMGTVFRVKDLNTGQEIALKILPPELSLNPALLQRFRREVMTLRQLTHPGIVRILDMGSEGRTYYFAMEYVGGGNLASLLEREGGQLPVEDAMDIVLQLAEALDYAHTKNIVHRDIKPSNVLLTEGGHPKLTDFGIAKVVEATRMTVTGGIVGTVDYMAPEQAEGRPIGPRTDIYSLGVLLYQMSTGRLPFKGETPSEVIQKHRFSLVEPPINLNPDMPENLSLVIEEMLKKDAAERFPSARLLIGVLRKIKSQMHPSDPSKRPTVYSLESFLPAERDTSVEGASPAAPAREVVPARPTPTPGSPLGPRPRRRRRPSYQEPPDWKSRIWLLVGVILLLVLVGLPLYSFVRRVTAARASVAELLDLGLEAERQGELDTARRYYRRLVDEHPGASEADRAREGLLRIARLSQLQWAFVGLRSSARYAEDAGDLEKAREILLIIKRLWPERGEWVDGEVQGWMVSRSSWRGLYFLLNLRRRNDLSWLGSPDAPGDFPLRWRERSVT